MRTAALWAGCRVVASPLLRFVVLSNHKLVIAKAKAKAKANCDSLPVERRPPAARPAPAGIRPRAGRAPSAGRRRFCYFPKAELFFFES